ncbi:hypothetical protein B0H14DRAFT_3634951 [Mycena olivaceomarginata]|nr:hypothetical protein B0H14DRAFT_3634951 [Mycena olivaceomarginata]
MSILNSEVPYTRNDLDVLKPALVAMVQRQIHKWPGNFSASKTTVARLRQVLSDPETGFTKAVESVQKPRMRKDSDLEVQRVKLLIEDARGPKPIKISQDILLTVVDQVQCGPREWRPVKLAIRDREYPDHRVYFVKVTDDALLEETWPSPEFAVIPSDNCLEIFVEQAEGTYFHANPAWATQIGSQSNPGSSLVMFDVNDPKAKPLEHARRRVLNNQNTSGNRNADVIWLSTEIKGLPGYEDYVNHRRKVQQNTGVVASWEFIALVSRTYFGQPSHITGGRRTKKIKKKSIQDALGIGSTSLAEAENAARILKRYGEGGTDPAQAVINRVRMTEAKPKGAKVLYPFLLEWERAHNYMSEPARASVAPKKAIAAVLYTTAMKEFDPQHPPFLLGAAGDAYAEKELKNPMYRKSDTEEADVLVKFCQCRLRSDGSRGLPRVLVRWYAGGADTCRVSAGQKKGYNLMVPKKAMAAGSYAVATTKVESQCPHISGGVGGDMSAEEKHIDSEALPWGPKPVGHRRDNACGDRLKSKLGFVWGDQKGAMAAPCTVPTSRESPKRRDYDDEQQFYPRSAIQPSAALENSSRQMVQKREALVVIGAAPEPQPPKWVGGKSEEGVFCEGTLGQRQAAKK